MSPAMARRTISQEIATGCEQCDEYESDQAGSNFHISLNEPLIKFNGVTPATAGNLDVEVAGLSRM